MGQIYDITPFTQLDYPDELGCIVWFSGCNLRCAYCHNPDIVLNKGNKEEADVLAFLQKRQGRLTAVVFSGGEATYCPSLPDLARQAKALGYKVKLDTNGSNPQVVRDMLAEGLLDYVALDYKCPPHVAEKLLGSARFVPAFEETLDLLIAAARDTKLTFEARTTVAFDYLTLEDLGWMIGDLGRRGYAGTYWLQNVVSSGDKTLGGVAEAPKKFDVAALPAPRGFALGYRNFPEIKSGT